MKWVHKFPPPHFINPKTLSWNEIEFWRKSPVSKRVENIPASKKFSKRPVLLKMGAPPKEEKQNPPKKKQNQEIGRTFVRDKVAFKKIGKNRTEARLDGIVIVQLGTAWSFSLVCNVISQVS